MSPPCFPLMPRGDVLMMGVKNGERKREERMGWQKKEKRDEAVMRLN